MEFSPPTPASTGYVKLFDTIQTGEGWIYGIARVQAKIIAITMAPPIQKNDRSSVTPAPPAQR